MQGTSNACDHFEFVSNLIQEALSPELQGNPQAERHYSYADLCVLCRLLDFKDHLSLVEESGEEGVKLVGFVLRLYTSPSPTTVWFLGMGYGDDYWG